MRRIMRGCLAAREKAQGTGLLCALSSDLKACVRGNAGREEGLGA